MMNYVISLFGLLILLTGVVIVAKPEVIFGLLHKHAESLHLHVLAVVVRLILGVVLIAYAAESRYPTILQVLGWLSIGAAMGLSVIGRLRFKSLMTWALNRTSSMRRVAGLFATIFGGFLVYAVI